jgi:hypothetical protein
VLIEPNAELLAGEPNVEQVREYLLDTPAEDWRPAYATVAGYLPLNDVTNKEEPQPIYLFGEVDVSVEGDVTFKVESSEPAQGWVDAQPVDVQQPVTTKLAAGRHKLILRVEPPKSEKPMLRVTVSKPDDSTAQFDIVAGQ